MKKKKKEFDYKSFGRLADVRVTPDRFRVEHRREIPSISAAQFFSQ